MSFGLRYRCPLNVSRDRAGPKDRAGRKPLDPEAVTSAVALWCDVDAKTRRLIERNGRDHEVTSRRSGTPEENLLIWTALMRQTAAWDLARGIGPAERAVRRDRV